MMMTMIVCLVAFLILAPLTALAVAYLRRYSGKLARKRVQDDPGVVEGYLEDRYARLVGQPG